MSIAAFWGTSVGYTDYHNGSVVLETVDGRVAVLNTETFEYLYHRLDDFNAALKEDCIQYVVHNNEKCLTQEPEWFMDAVADGLIYEESSGVCVFYSESGDIMMNPNSTILRNYRGELRYLEGYKFHQYYDTLEE